MQIRVLLALLFFKVKFIKMQKEKIVSLCLMLLAIVFFFIYLWWGSTYDSSHGGYGVGIWLVSVGLFVIGAQTFYEK